MANPNEYLDQLVSLAKEQKAALEQVRIERAREIERLRGIKIMRMPLLTATGTNPFLISADQSQQFGGPQTPDPGYVWSLMDLTIEGMTTGATPDRMQIIRNGRIIWELNGNQYAQVWGKGNKILYAGEALGYQSPTGVAFNSTNKIFISGSAWQVPAEEIGKLI